MAFETLKIYEVGEIREIKKGIAKVAGLENCMNGQLLDIPPSAKGLVIGFVEGEALVFLLGRLDQVKIGDKISSRMEPFTIPVGKAIRGRIVSALAEPLDGKGPIATDKRCNVFREAPSVLERIPITDVFETGILAIDATIPVGKGQRELIIGDRMTGKTTVCVDTILNQAGKDIVCIYCCIGRSYSTLYKVVETFQKQGAMDYTIVVAATATTSAGEQYLAPYSASAIGEYFRDQGRDVFIVFDDLTKHAWAYRQLSLLLERAPGRDAYPGDIFYLHSQLVERAARLSPEFGGGTMTCFPIVDTLQGDITGYVPSNLVSMTDGQIYLNADLFSAGLKPAIDSGLSVSRIGNKVLCKAMKELSASLRLEYIQYNELLKVTKFKSNPNEETLQRLRRGKVMTQLLFDQEKNRPYALEEELLLLYALKNDVINNFTKDQVERFKNEIRAFAASHYQAVIKELLAKKVLTPEIKKGLNECLSRYVKEQATAQETEKPADG